MRHPVTAASFLEALHIVDSGEIADRVVRDCGDAADGGASPLAIAARAAAKCSVMVQLSTLSVSWKAIP